MKTSPETPVYVTLFGALRVRIGGREVDRFETRRLAALLACLALSPGRDRPREELMEMLWPDEDPEATRPRFRQVLASLRRVLEPEEGEAVVADRTMVRLDAARVISDASEFDRLAGQSERNGLAPAERLDLLRRAAALSDGEFLPGHYDAWASAERERLTAARRRVLNALGRALLEAGTPELAVEAAEYARRAVAADPLDEEGYGLLIRASLAAGRPADALRQYRDMEQVLWKELRAAPSTSLRELVEGARNGVAEPPPVAAVVAAAADSPVVAPAILAPVPSLPAPISAFFGRAEELGRLQTLLGPEADAARLVTLTGAGGSGKTRLALEAARNLARSYAGQVHFVSLTEVGDEADGPAALLLAVLQSVGPAGTQPTVDAVREALGACPALLLLDSFEHLSPPHESAATLRVLLERLPRLRCLVTSRRPLGVVGEQEMAVAPLPVPAREADLAVSPSVQLFVDRARGVRPGFDVTDTNAAAVAEVCRRLEGIPLALELAAAWAGVLSPEQILARLEQRFRLLVARRPAGADEAGDPRHRSLRFTLEDSYERLDADVRRSFARLSVFRGGCTLEAAEAVCDDPFALDHLQTLRECSLLLIDDAEENGEPRYRMLDTVREFAAEHLPAEDAAGAAARHAAFYLALAEEAEPRLIGPDQATWLDRLAQEAENLNAALAWCAGPGGDGETGLRLATALGLYWEVRGRPFDGEHWLALLLGRLPDAPDTLRARALAAWGALTLTGHDPAAAPPRLAEAHSLFIASGDGRSAARVTSLQAAALRLAGDTDAALETLAAHREVLEMGRDWYGLALSLGEEGAARRARGEWVAAAELLERSGALYRICGHRRGLAWCLREAAGVAGSQDRPEDALALLRDSLALSRDLGDRTALQETLYDLGAAALNAGDAGAAEAYLTEGAGIARTAGDARRASRFALRQGDVALLRGDLETALAHHRNALRLAEDAGAATTSAEAARHIVEIALSRGQSERASRLQSLAAVLEEEPAAGGVLTMSREEAVQHLLSDGLLATPAAPKLTLWSAAE